MNLTDLIMAIVVVSILIVVIIGSARGARNANDCEQYRDYKLSEVPAKCINQYGGVYH